MALKTEMREGKVTVKDSNGNERKVSFNYSTIPWRANDSKDSDGTTREAYVPSVEDLTAEFQARGLNLAEALHSALNADSWQTAKDRAVSLDSISADPEAAKRAARENITRMVLAGVLTQDVADGMLANLK